MLAYNEIYQQAIDHWPLKHQIDKMVEEMSELTTELMRLQDGRTAPDKIITEIADVQILSEQLALAFGSEKVEVEKRRKLVRLLQTIQNEKDKQSK